MDTCTEEVGLLKKKPCGEAAVTRCANCEQSLCSKHALSELSAAGKKTGKFMCKECSAAAKAYYQVAATAPVPGASKPPVAAKPAAPAPKPEESLGTIDFVPSDKPK